MGFFNQWLGLGPDLTFGMLEMGLMGSSPYHFKLSFRSSPSDWTPSGNNPEEKNSLTLPWGSLDPPEGRTNLYSLRVKNGPQNNLFWRVRILRVLEYSFTPLNFNMAPRNTRKMTALSGPGNSGAFLKEIPSLKLTGHPKWKVIFQLSIFRCYVNFR